jgi:uncharacterized repeat protein (TIGR01451 family)
VSVTFASAAATQGAYNQTSGAWTVGNLANSSAATLTLQVTPGLSTVGQSITNTATYTHTSGSGQASAAMTILAPPQLTVTKTITPTGLLEPGQALTYTVIVANSSETNAIGVQVTDSLPVHVNGTNLNATIIVTAGESVTFTLPATLSAMAPYSTVITNTAYYTHFFSSGQANTIFITQGPPLLFLPVIYKAN